MRMLTSVSAYRRYVMRYYQYITRYYQMRHTIFQKFSRTAG